MKIKSPLLFVLALVAVIIFSPLLTIWSLNTLFSLSIPQTLSTWLATVWLSTVTFGNVVSAINRDRE